MWPCLGQQAAARGEGGGAVAAEVACRLAPSTHGSGPTQASFPGRAGPPRCVPRTFLGFCSEAMTSMLSTIASTVTSSGCCSGAGRAPAPRPGAGGSVMLRQLMAGITMLLQKVGEPKAQGTRKLGTERDTLPSSRVGAALLCGVSARQSDQNHSGVIKLALGAAQSLRAFPLCPACTHCSGMLRTRWLNSFRADMVRPLAGWCVASRISWSQKLVISAAGGGRTSVVRQGCSVGSGCC